jgi:hypothetical protein
MRALLLAFAAFAADDEDESDNEVEGEGNNEEENEAIQAFLARVGSLKE